jgi:hypothetical protein
LVISVVDSLINRIVQLAQWRKHRRETLFEGFVEPTFIIFEQVHADYLKSFLEYRDAIAAPDADIRGLIDKIEADALFTAGDRAKVLEAAEAIGDELVGGFVGAIFEYIRGAVPALEAPAPSVSYVSNIWREEAMALMSPLAEMRESSRKEATGVIDDVVRKLQERYKEVVHEYESLRRKLR